MPRPSAATPKKNPLDAYKAPLTMAERAVLIAREQLNEKKREQQANHFLERSSLASFVESTTSGIKLEEWQLRICQRLQMLPEQKGQRLLLHAPPQFGKSLIVSQRFPAWVLGRYPNHRLRLACYNETHSEEFSKVNLSLMMDDSFRQWFPDPGAHLPTKPAALRWFTPKRMEARDGQPSFVALGLGSGFTGLGAELVICDDPYKNAEEAFSEATNRSIWMWWTQVVAPRLSPATNVVVMYHTWHGGDFAKKLEEQGGWEVWRFPAIADGLPNDCSGKVVGEPLSERFSVSHLEAVRNTIGRLEFDSLFQGTPGDVKGNLIRSEWFQDYEIWDSEYYRVHRSNGRSETFRRNDVWQFATVDWASSDAKKADWTACAVWGVTPRKDLLLLDVRRGREQGPEAKELVRKALRRWEPNFVVVEKNGLGLPMTQDLEREGWPIRGVFQSSSKPVRAQSLASAYETGRIFHPKDAEWLPGWAKELLAFPAGAHDDQLDCGSVAARSIAGVNTVISNFSPSTQVALDSLPYEDDLPLIFGWGFEPVPSCVVCQHSEGQLRALASLAGYPGEGVEAFTMRVAVWAKETVCPDGIVLSDLERMSFGPYEWLGGAKGNHITALYLAGEESGERLGLQTAPCMASSQDRDESLRKLCKVLTDEGLPSLVVDPSADELASALAGGYCLKTDPNGLVQAVVEVNASSSLVCALGCVASMLSAVRARHVDPLTRYAQAMSHGVSTARPAGYRGRGRR